MSGPVFLFQIFIIIPLPLPRDIKFNVIFIYLFDSGILLIIDLNKKKGKKGGGILFVNLQLNKCYVSTV
jgi:hypothetical protein